MNRILAHRYRRMFRCFAHGRAIAVAIALLLSIPAQAAISFVATGATASSTGSNNRTLVVPGIADNDLLVAHVAVRGNRAITPPAGWTLIDQVYVSGNKISQGVFYKVGLASESGAPATWTFSASDDNAGVIRAYRGVDTAAPIGVFSGSNGNSATMSALSITTTLADEWLLAVYGAADSRSSPTSTPAGMGERYDFGNGGNNNGLALAGDDEARPTAGATGNRVSVSSLSDRYVAQLVALKPLVPSAVVAIDRAGADPTFAATVSWTVTFATSVSGVGSGNFALVNSGLGGTPAITTVSGGGTTWTVSASTGSGSGTLGLNMANAAGVTPAPINLPYAGQVYTIDRNPPVVSSITRVDPSPTGLASVSWTATFSKNVSGVDAGDFSLAQAGGVSGALITAVTPVSGAVYTVTASTGTGSGTLGLNLVDNDSIIDGASTPLGGAGAGNGNFTGEIYSVFTPQTVTASPTACVNDAGIGTRPWGTLTGPLASNNNYATASVNDNQTSNYLKCTGYGFAIPTGATIVGITVNVERNASNTLVHDAAMRLVKAGVIDSNLANDRSTATNYTTTDVIEAHGGSADTWGMSWTAADINDASFGAALAAIKQGTAGGPRTVSVDHMPITVAYTLPGNLVVSIDRADPDPTVAASVSWTVTFSGDVSGVASGNFTLVNSGLGGAPLITSVSGGPAVWTVTASTGTGTGTLGLNMTDTTGVSPAIAGLPFAGQVYSVRPLVPVIYYHDTTNGVNIGFDGPTNVVSNTNVTVPPVITASLTLANTCTGSARSRNHPAGSYVHSRWYFTGNYAVDTEIGANPDGSAYLLARRNTDTVVVSLYDYDAVSGAKVLIGSSPAITLTGAGTLTAYPYTIGSPLYTVQAGHRLMLEYSFSQNATNDNARVYCSAADSYIRVTEVPAGGGGAGGPDHYELSLPTQSVACMPITVTVSACADASSPCTNLFAGVSGTTATLATSGGTLALTPVTFDATGVASTTLSYPAAPDATPVVLTLSGEQVAAVNPRQWCPDGTACVTANSGTTTFNTAGFLFSAAAGSGVATLSTQTAGISSVTNYLRAVKSNTSTQACEAALVGANAVDFAYECINPGNCYTSNLMSLNGGAATTIARNNSGSVASYLPVNMTFDANGNAPLTFNYSDVGEVKLWVRKAASGSLLSTLTGSSNSFVVKPHHLSITGIACAVLGAGTCAPANVTGNNPAAFSAAGAAFIQAGRLFKATVTAMNGAATPAPTPSFGKEAPAEGAELISYNHLPGLGAATAIGRVLGGFNSGAATLNDLAWNEVGVLQLRATLSNANGYLGSDIVNGKNSVVSAADPYVGRFIPDHLDTVVTAQGGGFAYSGNPAGPVPGQPFTVTVTAKNASATATANYYNAGAYAKNINLSVPVGGATGQLYVDALAGGTGAVPAAKFLNLAPGEGKVNYSDATGKISFVFNSLPYAAQAIQIHAEDADTVASSGSNGNINIRHGRLRMFNAFGSDKADLSLSLRADYWTGKSWTPNGDDSVTAIPAAAVALSTYTGTLSAANLGAAHVTGTTLAAGQGSIVLTKPVPAATGSVDLAINLGTGAADQSCLSVHPATTGAAIPWLRSINGSCAATYDRDPAARGSFGVYAPETRKTIHMRELY